MTTREMWRTEAGKMLTAEIDGMRLIVEMPEEAGGSVRFQVLRRVGTKGPDELIASGARPDVRAAMVAAEEMAASRRPG